MKMKLGCALPMTCMILACYIICGSLLMSHCHGVIEEAKTLKSNEDLEIEHKLKLINKPAVKIVKSINGERYGCVDFYKQPGLDHSSMKNHTFHHKMRMSYSKGSKMKRKTHRNRTFGHFWENGVGCPIGTVPIPRVTKDALLRMKSFDSDNSNPQSSWSKIYKPASSIDDHHFAVVRTTKGTRSYNGASMNINTFTPSVGPMQFSASRMHFQIGNEFIQVGWIVHPQLYHDFNSRIFVFTKSGGNACYNLFCPDGSGMILVRQDLTPGLLAEQKSIDFAIMKGLLCDGRVNVYSTSPAPNHNSDADPPLNPTREESHFSIIALSKFLEQFFIDTSFGSRSAVLAVTPLVPSHRISLMARDSLGPSVVPFPVRTSTTHDELHCWQVFFPGASPSTITSDLYDGGALPSLLSTVTTLGFGGMGLNFLDGPVATIHAFGGLGLSQFGGPKTLNLIWPISRFALLRVLSTLSLNHCFTITDGRGLHSIVGTLVLEDPCNHNTRNLLHRVDWLPTDVSLVLKLSGLVLISNHRLCDAAHAFVFICDHIMSLNLPTIMLTHPVPCRLLDDASQPSWNCWLKLLRPALSTLFSSPMNPDKINGNWWLLMGTSWEEVGFWPSSRFKESSGTMVEWGGEVYSPSPPNPPMGNSHYPKGSPKVDSYVRLITTVDENYNTDKTVKNTERYSDSCYKVRDATETFWSHVGHLIIYGGPGCK
ncbi:putative neprosin [Arabidopsis thaliana]